jgi:hypothetical protein
MVSSSNLFGYDFLVQKETDRPLTYHDKIGVCPICKNPVIIYFGRVLCEFCEHTKCEEKIDSS